MGAKKADRWIVASLLLALVAELILLLWHLGFFPSTHSVGARAHKPAGLIVKNENELRRRSADSLVWEKTARDESVFYYDSLLTLTQSTASLKLEHETEIDLQENTLVTIEPTEDAVSGEIRLKFTRGNLRARNPFSLTKVAAPEFSVELNAGSEMQLRQTGEREFEVQVLKGEAAVVGEDGTHKVNPSTLLRMQAGQGKSLVLDTSLRWQKRPASRLYFHEAVGSVTLNWEGQATALHLQKSSSPELILELKPEQRSMRLELERGDYRIYLREGQNTSSGLALQIWKAPLLHLISPLPRDRVRSLEDISFLWMRTMGIATYDFKLAGQKTSIQEERPVNMHQLRFQNEDDARWSVWGKDVEGFMIPPLYEYPLFIRHEPLAAPRLNAPRVRKPAQAEDKGAFFRIINWLLPMAHADEGALYEAYFSWGSVPGADEYWLEISETPDFRKPIVSQRLGRTNFVWREFRDRIYYWRVAAGQKSGRMGLFSAPEKISAQEGIELRKIEITEKPATEDNKVPQTAEKMEEEIATAPEAVKINRLQKPRDFRIFWKPGFGLWQSKSEKNVSGNLSGPKILSLSAEKDLFIHDGRWWSLEAKYSSTTFQPKSKTEYPFQNDVTANTVEMRFTRVQQTRNWSLGINVGVQPRLEREGLEKVRTTGYALGGIHARVRKTFWGGEYQGDMGLNAGSGDYGVSTSQRWLRPLWRDRLLLGIGIEGMYLLRGSYNSLSADGFLTLGLEF